MDKKKVDVVLGIKVNVCYSVEVAEINPAAIQKDLYMIAHKGSVYSFLE